MFGVSDKYFMNGKIWILTSFSLRKKTLQSFSLSIYLVNWIFDDALAYLQN